jgi:23S rRNA pseudouridine1911/1915/1917 synthase
VIGDRIYGGRRNPVARNYERGGLRDFPRQALHAESLGFCHPRTGVVLKFYAPLALDMQRLLDFLREQHGSGGLTKTVRGVDKEIDFPYYVK